jgi:hypothetical protein
MRSNNDNVELANKDTEQYYYSCCGKSICKGCIHYFRMSGNHEQCAFCKAERKGKTEEKEVKEMLKRVEANDASAMYHLARYLPERRRIVARSGKGTGTLR